MWAFGSSDVLFQHNYCEGTRQIKYDGEAWDFDTGLSGTCIYQFNFSRDNEGGFLLSNEEHRPNYKRICRFNISVDDGGKQGVGEGFFNNIADYYNNTFWRTDGKPYFLPDNKMMLRSSAISRTISSLPPHQAMLPIKTRREASAITVSSGLSRRSLARMPSSPTRCLSIRRRRRLISKRPGGFQIKTSLTLHRGWDQHCLRAAEFFWRIPGPRQGEYRKRLTDYFGPVSSQLGRDVGLKQKGAPVAQPDRWSPFLHRRSVPPSSGFEPLPGPVVRIRYSGMTVPVEKRRYTIAEYLAMEEKATDRHEFHDCEILAMPADSYRHSRTNTNLLELLGTRLRATPGEPLDSNMRVRITGRRSYLYPDISIVCGGPQFDADDPRQTMITNPRIVVEVSSHSTELYDRVKFRLYREIPSLRQYVLGLTARTLAETYLRQAEGAWLLNPIKGLPSSLLLQSPHVSIPLAEIYAGVEFEATDSSVS